MKRVAAVLCLIAVVAMPAGAADSASRQVVERPTIPPRDPNPFGAIETRPLWDRPPSSLSQELTLQRRTADSLDRSAGRIEDDATFELRQLERERLDRSAQQFDELEALPPSERDRLDPLRAQLERQRQLDEQRWKLEQARRRQQRLEREEEALAEVRRRWAAEANRPNSALGAVVDRQALVAIEKEYQSAISAAERAHADAMSAIAADESLSDVARAARRAEADEKLEQSRSAAARRWEERRQMIRGPQK